jgi:type IV pilus assembly protein PilX
MNIQYQHKQQGVALVVSLIILVSLTMLGLTSIQRTTTDLAMAGNQRETGLMFQAAEVGLISAENNITSINSNGDFDDPSVGFYTVRASDPTYFSPDYFDDSLWTSNSTPAAYGAASYDMVTNFGLKKEPRYMIEYLGDRSQNPLATINIGGYGSQQPGIIVSIYRSTARGVGLTGNSSRYVQSYFGKRIN